MQNQHTIIIPGVGDSDAQHWQTWLQTQISNSSRVIQHDWHRPILDEWAERIAQHIEHAPHPVQLVAHSFGCLSTLEAFYRNPHLTAFVQSILFVAPANPARFSKIGLATDQDTLAEHLKSHRITVPSLMILSKNDPWFGFDDAIEYSQIWEIPYLSQGFVGHINSSSGHGAWPDVLTYLSSLRQMHSSIIPTHHHLNAFSFAV